MNKQTCRICCRPLANPFRVYDAHGKVTEGCVSPDHDGHLVQISESNRWHNRKEAKAIRRTLKMRPLAECRAQLNPEPESVRLSRI